MSLWCWWCSHPIEGETLNFPFKYDDKRRTFHTMGFFCSWGCMKAYNLDKGGPRMGERQQFITLMRRHVYGTITSCPVAPKREALKVFGGKLTIDEFRKCPDVVDIKMPFSVFHSCVVKNDGPAAEAVPTSASLKSSEQKLQTIRDSVQTGDQLKLRRPKPLKRTESALEKSLKLKKRPDEA